VACGPGSGLELGAAGRRLPGGLPGAGKGRAAGTLAADDADGFGEEVGWRGYALPLLLSRFRAVPASLLLGVAWAAWHLPLAWTPGASLENAPVIWLFIDLPVTAIVYTWVFRHTRVSASVAAVFHAALNLWAIPMPQGATEPLAPYLFGLGSRVAVAGVLVLMLGSQLTRETTAPPTSAPGTSAPGTSTPEQPTTEPGEPLAPRP
jgi:hypothetical protein